MLRPVVLPPDLIGKRAPCDLFNARGVLLVNADSVIGFSVRNPFRPTRVFCPADRAACISDANPIFQLTKIGKTFAEIAERLARSEPVSASEISRLAQTLYEAWVQDADACLGYARLCKVGRPSICHVVHAALLVAELAAAHRLDSEQVTNAIGGALTMNIAKLRLHDEMHACTDMPSAEQISEIHAHPDESVRLLGGLGKFDKSWLDAVGSHHENLDGSGYFRSLKGAEIPLSARMLRVADIFAARLTGRKKRPPLHWNILRTRSIQNIVQHIFGNDQPHLDSPLMTQLIGALGHFPPGSLVRLRNGELAVVARRIPGELASPREVLSIRDALGHVLQTPRRRRTGHGESEIRNYANDEAQRFPAYDWQQVWGYGAWTDQR
jgi:HD-GYP domain-containing protein (c-di-GMP phosphodiesterase class II)